MRPYWIIGLLHLSSTLMAQTDTGSVEFFNSRENCATSFGGWKCLELDLSSEFADEGDSTKVYEYSWNFGDGTRQQGTRTEHCYETFGQYQIALDLIDVETRTVIRNELSSTIFLYPEVFPSIHMSTDGVPPSFMKFYCVYGEEGFVPDHIYWRIGGDYYEGEIMTHAFPVAGVYLVEVGLVKDMEFLGRVTACASLEVRVEKSNVWTSPLLSKIRELRATNNTGPYVNAGVLCLVRESYNSEHTSSLIPLQSLMSQVKLKAQATYEISLVAGNLVSETAKMNTEGIFGNDLYLALRDVILALGEQPFTALPSLKTGHGRNGIADEPKLRETVDLLHRYPTLRVEIGSYVHTGSRLAKSISESVMRASMVKDEMVRRGIPAERISIASPENNHTLINTCSALPQCDWEDPTLNGMIEFKITGATL